MELLQLLLTFRKHLKHLKKLQTNILGHLIKRTQDTVCIDLPLNLTALVSCFVQTVIITKTDHC